MQNVIPTGEMLIFCFEIQNLLLAGEVLNMLNMLNFGGLTRAARLGKIRVSSRKFYMFHMFNISPAIFQILKLKTNPGNIKLFAAEEQKV